MMLSTPNNANNHPFQVTTRLEPTPKTPHNPLAFELLTFAVFA